MPYSGNFTRVTFVEDDRDTGDAALRVEGTSQDADDAQAIYVALPRAGELLMATVQNVTGAADWSATFPQENPPFEVGEPLIVVGMAILRSTNRPFFWAERFGVTARTDPP
jgi:hypothetical protein